MSTEVENVHSGENALLSRLQGYSVVSAATGYYKQLKNSSPLATVRASHIAGMITNALCILRVWEIVTLTPK